MNLNFDSLSDAELVEVARQLALRWKQRFKTRLGIIGITSELIELPPFYESVKEQEKFPMAKGPLFGGKHTARKILDTWTGEIYKSKTECGKKLATSAGADEKDNFAYYKVEKYYPGRFKEV